MLFKHAMRLITLVALALVMSTSALPRTASENDLKRNQKKAQRRDGGDAQCSLSKVNEYSHIFHQAYTIHLALDKRVICSNFAQDGQANATEGQVPSLTSKNNFIMKMMQSNSELCLLFYVNLNKFSSCLSDLF